jgi:hypothetical protein
MKDTAQSNDIGRFDFDYFILVANVMNGTVTVAHTYGNLSIISLK